MCQKCHKHRDGAPEQQINKDNQDVAERRQSAEDIQMTLNEIEGTSEISEGAKTDDMSIEERSLRAFLGLEMDAADSQADGVEGGKQQETVETKETESSATERLDVNTNTNASLVVETVESTVNEMTVGGNIVEEESKEAVELGNVQLEIGVAEKEVEGVSKETSETDVAENIEGREHIEESSSKNQLDENHSNRESETEKDTDQTANEKVENEDIVSTIHAEENKETEEERDIAKSDVNVKEKVTNPDENIATVDQIVTEQSTQENVPETEKNKEISIGETSQDSVVEKQDDLAKKQDDLVENNQNNDLEKKPNDDLKEKQDGDLEKEKGDKKEDDFVENKDIIEEQIEDAQSTSMEISEDKVSSDEASVLVNKETNVENRDTQGCLTSTCTDKSQEGVKEVNKNIMEATEEPSPSGSEESLAEISNADILEIIGAPQKPVVKEEPIEKKIVDDFVFAKPKMRPTKMPSKQPRYRALYGKGPVKHLIIQIEKSKIVEDAIAVGLREGTISKVEPKEMISNAALSPESSQSQDKEKVEPIVQNSTNVIALEEAKNISTKCEQIETNVQPEKSADSPVQQFKADVPIVQSEKAVVLTVESSEADALLIKSSETVVLPLESAQGVGVAIESPETVALPVESIKAVVLPVESTVAVVLPVESTEAVVLPVESTETVVLPVGPTEAVVVPVGSTEAVETSEIVQPSEPDEAGILSAKSTKITVSPVKIGETTVSDVSKANKEKILKIILTKDKQIEKKICDLQPEIFSVDETEKSLKRPATKTTKHSPSPKKAKVQSTPAPEETIENQAPPSPNFQVEDMEIVDDDVECIEEPPVTIKIEPVDTGYPGTIPGLVPDDDDDGDVEFVEDTGKAIIQIDDEETERETETAFVTCIYCQKCGKKNQNVDDLMKHLEEHKIMFNCLVCHKSHNFKSLQNLTQHCNNLHKSKILRQKEEEMRKQKKSNAYDYFCEKCGFGFLMLHQYMKHTESNHKNIMFACHMCSRGYPTMTSLQSHFKYGHESPQIKCILCNETFRNDDEFTKHIFRHRNMEERVKLSCKICSRATSTIGEFREHYVTHKYGHPENYYCSYCKRYYMTEEICRMHIKDCRKANQERSSATAEPTKKKFTCVFCDESFQSQNSLVLHKNKLGDNPCTGKRDKTKGKSKGNAQNKEIHPAVQQAQNMQQSLHFVPPPEVEAVNQAQAQAQAALVQQYTFQLQQQGMLPGSANAYQYAVQQNMMGAIQQNPAYAAFHEQMYAAQGGYYAHHQQQQPPQFPVPHVPQFPMRDNATISRGPQVTPAVHSNFQQTQQPPFNPQQGVVVSAPPRLNIPKLTTAPQVPVVVGPVTITRPIITKPATVVSQTATPKPSTLPGQSKYKCFTCEKEFTSVGALNLHNTFVCKKTEQPVEKPREKPKLDRNKSPPSKESGSEYKCHLCKSRFSLYCNLVNHLKTHSKTPPSAAASSSSTSRWDITASEVAAASKPTKEDPKSRWDTNKTKTSAQKKEYPIQFNWLAAGGKKDSSKDKKSKESVSRNFDSKGDKISLLSQSYPEEKQRGREGRREARRPIPEKKDRRLKYTFLETCAVCNEVFTNEAKYNEHKEFHEEDEEENYLQSLGIVTKPASVPGPSSSRGGGGIPEIHRCYVCNQVFTSRNALNTHRCPGPF